MHHCCFIQELCIADNNMVVPMQLRLPSEQQQSRKNYTTLLLLCKAESASSRAFLAMTSRSIKSKQNPLTYHVHFGEEYMLARRRWW